MIAGTDERDLQARVAGRRVLVTRPEDGGAVWAEELERLGAVPVLRPVLVTETLRGDATLARTRATLEGADWIVLTSARAVDALEEIAGRPLALPAPVAAVGAATARRAREAGLDVRLEAAGGTMPALAAELGRALGDPEPARPLPLVVHAGAEETRPGLERLEDQGRARVVHVAVYRTRPAPGLPEAQREDLDVDVVLLASPSAVRGLLGRARIPDRARVVTIGPSTTAAARDAGLAVAGEAVTRDLLGLLRALPREITS